MGIETTEETSQLSERCNGHQIGIDIGVTVVRECDRCQRV